MGWRNILQQYSQQRSDSQQRGRNPGGSGNPGGVNNTRAPVNYGYSQDADYGVYRGGQNPNLGRYVPPTLAGDGANPLAWNQSSGGYSYNLPNDYGPYPWRGGPNGTVNNPYGSIPGDPARLQQFLEAYASRGGANNPSPIPRGSSYEETYGQRPGDVSIMPVAGSGNGGTIPIGSTQIDPLTGLPYTDQGRMTSRGRVPRQQQGAPGDITAQVIVPPDVGGMVSVSPVEMGGVPVSAPEPTAEDIRGRLRDEFNRRRGRRGPRFGWGRP